MSRTSDSTAALPIHAPCLRAGNWFLRSGIQEPAGGVARFYLVSERRNRAVSTEITGYTASTYAWLYRSTGDPLYLAAAKRTAAFLAGNAWLPDLKTFPFELVPGAPAYFFDCGIIVRGLLAVWRITGDGSLLGIASAAARSMARDFLTSGAIHPVVSLPDRAALPYEKRWSREPGCYQLKSALAWRDLWVITGENCFRDWWEQALDFALPSHDCFLPGAAEPEKVMDRLHAYNYFMEALLGEPDRAGCAETLARAIDRTAAYVRQISPHIARSDVYAQLLRVRLLAGSLGMVALDAVAAEQEASAISQFQYTDPDPRLDGAFSFGARQDALLPFANPVSTAFCIQALDAWRRRDSRDARFPLDELI